VAIVYVDASVALRAISSLPACCAPPGHEPVELATHDDAMKRVAEHLGLLVSDPTIITTS
jgi:hypothetical protein